MVTFEEGRTSIKSKCSQSHAVTPGDLSHGSPHTAWVGKVHSHLTLLSMFSPSHFPSMQGIGKPGPSSSLPSTSSGFADGMASKSHILVETEHLACERGRLCKWGWEWGSLAFLTVSGAELLLSIRPCYLDCWLESIRQTQLLGAPPARCLCPGRKTCDMCMHVLKFTRAPE